MFDVGCQVAGARSSTIEHNMGYQITIVLPVRWRVLCMMFILLAVNRCSYGSWRA